MSPEGRARALALPFALAAFLSFLPLPVATVTDGLDPSWHQALHVAVERGMAFGTELVFTYGPLGFVHPRIYWPGLFPVTLAFWALLALATLDCWGRLARGASVAAVAAWPLLAIAGSLVGIFTHDTLVFVYLVVWILRVEADEASTPWLAGHGAMVGLLALSKLTFAAAGALALAVCATLLVLRGLRGRSLVPAVVAFLVFAGGWWGLAQPMSGLVPYVRNAWEIVAGYPEAMALRGPIREMRQYGWLCVLMLGIVAWGAVRRRDRPAILACLFTAAICGLAWKQAFTRHDAHVILAFVFLCLAAAAMAMRLRGAAAVACTAISIAALGFGLAAIVNRSDSGPGQVAVEVLRRPIVAAASLPSLFDGTADARHAAAMARLRAHYQVPRLPGTVDVYSVEQAAVFAHGMRWSPRPVFQSYSAYTSRLAEINRDHLRGPAAADHVVFRVQPIDGRHAPMEDGASWLDLLERYSLREEGAFAILDRQAVPRPATRRAPVTWQGRGWRELERGGVVQLAAIESADLRHWIAGAFRGPPLYDIELRTADGQTRKLRFLRNVARVPFIVSPLVETTSDFAGLFDTCGAAPASREVVALRILDSRGNEVPYRLDLQVVDELPRFPESAGARVRGLACELVPVDAHASMRASPVLGDAAGSGLNAHPPATFRVAKAIRNLRVCARIHEHALAKGESDGYALAVFANGGRDEIARLDVPADAAREEACLVARVASPTPGLELRVEPRANDRWDWIYLTRVAFDE